MTMRWTLMGLCLGWLFVAPTLAATRYVDGTNGLDTNPGTITQPFKGITKAAQVSAAGDVTIVRAGTYNYNLGNSTPFAKGTSASNRTVLMAYPITRTCVGHNPSDLTCYKDGVYELVTIIGNMTFEGGERAWITIEGFDIDGPGNAVAIRASGSPATNPPDCTIGSTLSFPNNLRFVKNTFRDTANSGIQSTHGAKDIEILYNHFLRNGDSALDHGAYISVDGLLYMGNIAEYASGIGTQFYRGTPTGGANASCIPQGNNMRVIGNIFRNNTHSGVYLGGYTFNGIAYNNLSYNNGDRGMFVGSTYRAWNNTIVNNAGTGIVVGSGHNQEVLNNITDAISYQDSPSDALVQNNYNACPSCTQPPFVNPAAGDFRLLAGAPQINAGMDLTSRGVTKDFSGTTRPQGGTFDIGAYEFVSGVTPFDYRLSTNIVEEEELSVIQGASAQATITITRLSGTAQAITLSATGLPLGMTASFSPTSCTPTVTSCTMTLTLDSTHATPEGTYSVLIHGTAAGLTRSVPIDITVSCVF